MGNTGIKRQKSPNNLINADHYHGGKLKFIGFAKVPAVIKLIADYPWQVIKTLAEAHHEFRQIGMKGMPPPKELTKNTPVCILISRDNDNI